VGTTRNTCGGTSASNSITKIVDLWNTSNSNSFAVYPLKCHTYPRITKIVFSQSHPRLINAQQQFSTLRRTALISKVIEYRAKGLKLKAFGGEIERLENQVIQGAFHGVLGDEKVYSSIIMRI